MYSGWYMSTLGLLVGYSVFPLVFAFNDPSSDSIGQLLLQGWAIFCTYILFSFLWKVFKVEYYSRPDEKAKIIILFLHLSWVVMIYYFYKRKRLIGVENET